MPRKPSRADPYDKQYQEAEWLIREGLVPRKLMT